jgi:uncharacterized protein (DUF2235 family)
LTPERTRAERLGYHRGWKKRMLAPMLRAVGRLRERRAELLRQAADLNTAILTIERMLSLRIDDVKGR